MHPKDLAARHDVKVFDSLAAAEKEGFTLGQRMSPRNVWNRDSAASAIVYDLIGKRKRGEVSDIALVLETGSVAAAYKTAEANTNA
jgi:methylphosphotriester-DNA--protein-cysteine methyltransferase